MSLLGEESVILTIRGFWDNAPNWLKWAIFLGFISIIMTSLLWFCEWKFDFLMFHKDTWPHRVFKPQECVEVESKPNNMQTGEFKCISTNDAEAGICLIKIFDDCNRVSNCINDFDRYILNGTQYTYNNCSCSCPLTKYYIDIGLITGIKTQYAYLSCTPLDCLSKINPPLNWSYNYACALNNTLNATDITLLEKCKYEGIDFLDVNVVYFLAIIIELSVFALDYYSKTGAFNET
jgi:hypothetical protein